MGNPAQRSSHREFWQCRHNELRNAQLLEIHPNMKQRLEGMETTFQTYPLVQNQNWPSRSKRCGCPTPATEEANTQSGNTNPCTCDTCVLSNVPCDIPCQCNKQVKVQQPTQNSDNSAQIGDPKVVKNNDNVQGSVKRCGCPKPNDEISKQNKNTIDENSVQIGTLDYNSTPGNDGNLNSCTCQTCTLGDVAVDIPCKCIKGPGGSQPNGTPSIKNAVNVQNGNINPCSCQTCPLGDVPYNIPCQCIKTAQAASPIQRNGNFGQNAQATKNGANLQTSVKKCGCPFPINNEVNAQNGNINPCSCQTCPLGDVPYNIPCQCNKTAQAGPPIQRNGNFGQNAATINNSQPTKNEANLQRSVKNCGCPFPINNVVNAQNGNINPCSCQTCPLGDVSYNIPCQCTKSQNVPQPFTKKETDYTPKPVKDNINARGALKKCGCSYSSENVQISMQKGTNPKGCLCKTCPLADGSYGIPCQCNKSTGKAPSQKNYNSSQNKTIPSKPPISDACKCDPCPLADSRYQTPCQCNESTQPTKTSNSNNCKCKTCPLDPSTCPCNTLQKDNESCSCEESDSSSLPDNISVGQDDAEYVEKLRKMLENEKTLGKELDDLGRTKKCYEGRVKETQGLTGTSGSGDYEILNLKRLNEKLEENNNNLEAEIEETIANIKHLKENVEEPMKREIEAEKKKIRDLEEIFRRQQGGAECKRMAEEKEFEFFQSQLQHANQYLADLNMVNKRLKEELCMLNCRCSELQTDIINQKLSEIHTISRLYAQKRRDKKSIPKKTSKGSSDGGDEDGWDGGGGGPQPRHKGSRRSSSLSSSLSISCKDLSDIKVCPQDRPCPGKDGQPKGGTSQNELDVIAQNLEALLTQAAECQCTDSDLVDTVKYIKNLVDMLNVPDTVHVPSSESLPYCECAEDGICIDVTDDIVPTKDVEPPVVISEEDEILGQEILSVLLDYLDAQIDDTQIGAKVKCICPTPDEVSVPIPPEESIPTEAQGEEEKPVSDVIDRIEGDGDGDALGEGDEAQENVEAEPLDTTDAKVVPLDTINAEVAPLDTIDAEVAPLDTANAEGEEATQPEEICNDVEEVPEVVERRRVCYGPPCLKKLPPLKDVLAIGPDGRPINVLMGDDGKPKLDETGHLLDMNGHRIPSNYVLTAAVPVIEEQPIEEKVIEDAGLLEGGEADVVLDEQEKPLLEEEVAPEELQLDQEGVPVVDEKGDINLDEQAGEILDVPESEMDETGKPILDVALDEQAEVLGEIGEPTVDVMLVDQEKPLLDDSGRLFDETGALITCKSFGKPPCAIDVDDTILEETPVRPPCEIVDEDVELVPLPEAETTADILPSPDAESVKIISRSTEGDYVTTATASGSELHITTEGPIGLIDTTVKLTDSGNVQVHTDMTEFEEEKIIDEESLAPTDVTSEPTEESAHTEIDEGAIGDVARSEETEEETTEVESEATEEGADEESTPESIPPICEMEEPEEVSEIESVVKKPCVCKSDKACQCTATDQECQCEEEKEEEKVDDQEVDLGADEHICKPDICASGERGGDGPWKCECGKAKSTLCSECANKDDDDKGSRIQLDVTIRCDPPCCVIKSTTRYNDSDSSKSDSNNSVDNLSAIKSKSGSVKGVSADNCGDVGIQQNYYDLEDDDKAICTIPTCPVLIAKNKDVDTLVESKVKLGMTEHSSDTNGRQSRGPCCSCSKQTSTVETPQGNAQETPQETSQGEARKTSSKSCSCRLKGSRTTSGNVFSDRNAVSNYTQSTCDASTCPVRIQVSRDIEQGVPGDRDKQCTCGAPCCRSTVNAAISPINVRGTGSVCCRRSRRTTPLSGDSGQRSLVSSNTRNPCCCDSTAFGGTQRISSGRGSLKFDLSTGPSGRCICNGSQPFSEQSSKYEGGFSPMLECTCSDGSTAYDTPPQQCSNCKCTCDGDSQPFSQFTGCACSEQSTAIKTVDLDLKLPASESILEDPSCTSSTCEERDKTLDKPHGSNDCLKTCACIQESVSTMRSFDTEETPMCKPSFECLPICAKAICGKTTVDASVMTPSKSESIGDSQDVEGTCTPKTCKKGRAASRRSCSLPTCKKRRRLSSKGTIEEGDEETKKPPPGVMLDENGQPILDADGHMLTPSGHVLPDGVQIDAEGHLLTPSGHIIPPGVQLDESGHPLLDAEGHMLTASGHVLPEGVQIDAEGHLLTPSGHIIPPGVQLDESGHPLLDAEGHMLTASGHVLPEGVQIDAEGHLLTPSGHIIPPGVQLDESGHPLLDAEGHMLTASGHVLPEGVQIDAEGHIVTPSGHVLPAGVQMDAEGHMLTASGHIIQPGVQLDESGHPLLDAEGHMLTASGHVLPEGVQIDAEGHLLTPSGHIIPPGVQLDESGHPLLDAEGHMLTASGHVLPEGVQIDAEGHLLTPSGHIIPPGVQLDESGHPLLDAEGHMLTASGHVLPEGVQIDAEGHLLTPSGHIIPPGVQLDESGHPLLDAEGHMLTASGHVLPEGVQIDAEGHIVTPSGHVLPPGAQLDESGHPILDAEGHMLTASGHALPDGVQIDAEGHIVSPSGHILPPGVQLDESGHPMLDAEGHMLTASGHVLPDGVQIDAEGHIVTPSGHVLPDGVQMDAEGHMVTASGHVLPPGVQLDASGKPLVDAEGHMLTTSGHVLPDGVQMDAEGHMVTASGHVLPPGVQLDASGKPLVDAEGHMLTTSGHVLPDGVQMDAEGHMVTASGHVLPPGVQLDATGKPLVDAEGHILTTSGHVLPAGVQMDAEGHMVTASGHVLPPGVQLDASGKPLVDAEGHMLTTSGHVLPADVQMDAEGHMVTASGHVLPPGVQLDASGKPLVDAEGHMLTTSGHVLPEGVQMDAEGHMVTASGHAIPPGVQLDASGQPILDAEGHMLTADGTPVMGEDLAKMGALGPDGTPTGAPIGCKCKKCNIAICECKEPVCETDQHPPNCTCIDCICDPSKFDRSTVGDAAHPPDCVCVDCLCDPSNGFLKTSVEVEGPKDAHKVPCDCQVCLCTPCADETKNFVCPTSLPPHHPDCTCAECLCEECIHVPDCDCPECICARCARFNVPTNPCTCPECVCAPCGDTEKFPEAERQDAGDKLFEQYLVEGDAPIPGMKKIGELCGCEPMDQDDASKSGASKQLDANENSLPPLGPGKTRHPDCKCTPDCDCEKCLDIPPCECEDFLCENCADENMNRKKREFEAQHSPECDCPQCKCNPCRDKNMDLTCVCDENFTCENCLGKKAGVTCDCDENFTCDNCLYKKKKEGDAGGEGAEVEKGKEKDEVVSQHPVDCNCSSCKCNPCVDDVIEAQKKERAKACDTGAEKNDLCDCWFCMCKSCKDPKIRAITNAPISSIFKNWDQVDIPDLSPLKDAFKKTSQQPNGCQCHDCACDPCKLDPFRSSLNTGHGGKCTCTSCTCSGSKNKAEKKEHGKECNCDKCVCDPCDDPIFRTKRTLEKLKKDMPEPHSADCDCPICRCAPCMDPKHGPGCKCPECVCEPCPKQPQPTDKHGQSCKCPICSPVSAPHGPLCDCPQCLCKPCADVNIASSQSMEDKHGPSCQCPICGPLAVNHGKGCKCPVCAPKDKSKQSKHKSKSKSSRPCKCVGACSCGPSKKKQRSKSTDDDLRKKKKSKDNVAGCKCKHCQKSAKQENTSPDNADRKKEIEELEALMEQIRCSCDSAEVDAACHYSGSAPAPPPCPLKILDLQNSLKSLQQKCETKDKIIQEMQGKLQGKPDSGSVNAIPNNTPLPPPGPCGKCAPTAAIVSIKEVTRISSESVLVKWTQPCNNLVIGYEVSVNDVLRSRVHSAQRNSAVVFGVRSAKKATILVHAITHYGRCEPPASYDFES